MFAGKHLHRHLVKLIPAVWSCLVYPAIDLAVPAPDPFKTDPRKNDPLEIPCPACNHTLRCAAKLLNTQGQCPACQHIFTIRDPARGDQRSSAATPAAATVFTCPSCSQLFAGRPELDGQVGKCHVCQQVFLIELRPAPPAKPKPAPTAKPASTAAAASDNEMGKCPGCKQAFRLPANLQGKPFACPGCKTKLELNGTKVEFYAPVARAVNQPAKPTPPKHAPQPEPRTAEVKPKVTLPLPASPAQGPPARPAAFAPSPAPARPTASGPAVTPARPAPLPESSLGDIFATPAADASPSFGFEFSEPVYNPYAPPNTSSRSDQPTVTQGGTVNVVAASITDIFNLFVKHLLPATVVLSLILVLMWIGGYVTMFASIFGMGGLTAFGVPVFAGIGLLFVLAIVALFGVIAVLGAVNHCLLRTMRDGTFDAGALGSLNRKFWQICGVMMLTFIISFGVTALLNLLANLTFGDGFPSGARPGALPPWPLLVCMILTNILSWVIYMVFSFAPFAVFEGHGVIGSLQISLKVFTKNVVQILLLSLAMWFALILFTVFTCGLGMIFFSAAPMALTAAIYCCAVRRELY